MKSSRFRIAFLALLCSSPFLHADILLMKDGSKVEGTILNESPAAVRMRYRLTPTIWDEKDFPRTDIQQVVKQTPEEVEVVELRKVLPTADLLTADKYEQLIQNRLRPFINKYKGTKEATEVEGIIATLQEEKSKVANGQIKLEGRWLSEMETKGEKFNIEAFGILTEMRDKAAEKDWLGALRKFDEFSTPRPGYIASTYYPAAVSLALDCMTEYEKNLTKMASDQPQIVAQRQEGLKKQTEPDLSRTKAGIDQEVAKWKAQSEVERRNRLRWIAPYKYDMASILAAQKALITERARLEAYDLAALKTQNEAFVEVYRKIGQGDYTAGSAAYSRLNTTAAPTEFRDVANDLRNRLMRLYTEIVQKGSTGTTVTSGSSAIGGTAATGIDPRVASILAENKAATAPAPVAQAVAMPGTAATAATPVAAQPATAVRPATAPVAAPVVQPQRPAVPVAAAPVAQQPAYAPVAQMPPPAPPAEESNLQTYIIIGMGVLLVLLGVAFLQQKKKQVAE